MIMTNGEMSTDMAAAAALASPLWLPWLHTASAFAAMLLPLLGGVWLFVQITAKLFQLWQMYRAYRNRK